MKQILIVPDKQDMQASIELSKKYGTGFEFNMFSAPEVLDDSEKLYQTMDTYKTYDLPEYCTMHGAFLDVIPFSPDKKIREISDVRIRQSLEVAKGLGLKAVVFHTNYNPFLNAKEYVKQWVDTNAEYWKTILEQYPDINIYLENMFDETPEVLELLSERLGKFDNYGVCLDYSHAFLSKTQPEEWAKRLSRFVKHVHLNDNDGKSDLHMAWGDGVIDRNGFYQSYRKYLSNATVLLETTGTENIVRSLKTLKEEGFTK